MKKKHRGFTLAELILCIGIIGVVSAMGMTIARINTDRAYNMYYYTGYINLYNAIADAKANGIEDNQAIMQHVYKLLSKDANVAFVEEMNGVGTLQVASLPNTLNIPFLTYKAKLDSFGTEGGIPLPGVDIDSTYDSSGSHGGGSSSGGSSSSNTGSSNNNNNNNSGGSGDSGNGNGSGGDSGNGNGSGDNTSNGTITKAIPIIMTVPQRNGYATVRLLYVNLNGGYLIPVPASGCVDLQNRQDLLSAFVDDGKVGRNNAISRTNFSYTRPAYSSYREIFCSISGLGSINGVISCNGVSANKTGILRVADPRKAR